MNHYYKIKEVLEALGDEQLSSDEIVPRLKDFETSARSLTYFINEYMVNRYVMKERMITYTNRKVKFQRIPGI